MSIWIIQITLTLISLTSTFSRSVIQLPINSLFHSPTHCWLPSYSKNRSRIESLNTLASPPPTTLEEISGEWELVLSTVPHGIFRSSPFFLAIQEAFVAGGEPDKANLFFKLHELQVMSWGASKIGRVAQVYNHKIILIKFK